MPTADGTMIEPTGRAFTIPMATIGRWEDGTMSEEWLFWDNQLFMRQIGLAERRAAVSRLRSRAEGEDGYSSSSPYA